MTQAEPPSLLSLSGPCPVPTTPTPPSSSLFVNGVATMVSYHDTYIDTPLFSPPPSSNNSKSWGPYSSAEDFTTNMFLILAVLFCTLLLALALGATIRFFLCRRHSLQLPGPSAGPEKPRAGMEASLTAALPTLVISAGTELAGMGAECAICLTEFAEGDGIKVLPACKHGFHVTCIKGWLTSSCSCPTCRRCCRVPVAEVEKSAMEEP